VAEKQAISQRSNPAPDKHHYHIDGDDYVRTTYILDNFINKAPGLMQWSANLASEYQVGKLEEFFKEHGGSFTELTMPAVQEFANEARFNYKQVANRAKDIGKIVHTYIERHIKEGKGSVYHEIIEEGPEVKNAFEAFLKWEAKNVVRWIASELTVYSTKYKYAGTLDTIVELQGKYEGIYLTDWKSSKAFRKEYGLQVAAYKSAFLDMGLDKTMLKIDNPDELKQGVLRLDKETGKPYFKDYSPNYQSSQMAFIFLLSAYYQLQDQKKKR